MGVDASAVARVLGISATYKDLRSGGVLFLAQHIFVMAQGNTGAVFSNTKFLAGSAGEMGAIAGYGSPAHLIMRELRPPTGGGVGAIPITMCLLSDDASGVAAAGEIAVSGTQTAQGEYVLKVGNIAAAKIVIPAGANATTAARLIGAAVASVLEMPVNHTQDYGTVVASALTGTGNGTLTSLAVHSGSTPAPGVYRLQLVTAVANGGVWRLTAPDGTIISSSITQTVGAGAATAFSNIGGLDFTVTDGSTDFGVGAYFDITVPSTAVNLVAKWKGASGNGLKISFEGPDLGITFAITQPTGGAANPSLAGALAQMGTNVWYSLVLNSLNISDTTALDAIRTAGEPRWGETVRRPFLAFTGVTDATVAAATAVSSVRRTDRVNAQLVEPGSNDIPFVVAAAQLALIAKLANNNPPVDYGSQRALSLTPGTDAVQWDYILRQQAVLAGSSTVEVKDGVTNISDVVTFYRPTGEEPPAYRYVVDVIKLMNVIYNIELIFANAEWDGAPLVPDDQVVVNRAAKKPKLAKAAVNAKLDGLGLEAIISDPKSAKKTTTANISPSNPKRLDVATTVQLSGNSNIISVDLNFGFFFGQASQAA